MTAAVTVVRSSLRCATHSESNRSRARELTWRWVRSKWPRLVPPNAELESDLIERAASGQALKVAGSADGSTWKLSLAHEASRGGRTWMTEVQISDVGDGDVMRVQASCVGDSGSPLVVAPPRLLGLWVQHLELDDGGVPIISEPRAVENRQQAQAFCEHVLSDARGLPVIALANNTRSKYYGVDPGVLAEAVCGMAHVACLAPEASGIVTETLGLEFGPQAGAARIYGSGFNARSAPGDHPVIEPSKDRADGPGGNPPSFRSLLVQNICTFSVGG